MLTLPLIRSPTEMPCFIDLTRGPPPQGILQSVTKLVDWTATSPWNEIVPTILERERDDDPKSRAICSWCVEEGHARSSFPPRSKNPQGLRFLITRVTIGMAHFGK